MILLIILNLKHYDAFMPMYSLGLIHFGLFSTRKNSFVSCIVLSKGNTVFQEHYQNAHVIRVYDAMVTAF